MCIHTHNGIVFNHKKNKILPFATRRMDLENIMLNQINRNRLTDTENKFMVTKGGKGCKLEEWD